MEQDWRQQEEIWTELEEFPNYLVSNFGEVVNRRFNKSLSQSRTGQGTLKVGLWQGDKQVTRSVRVLVADSFVPGRTDIYDTPIQLNGDPLDIRASNLAWRPRWFAWKFSRQFLDKQTINQIGPIRDMETGDVYETVYDAGIVNGLLFTDIRRSIFMKDSCFPTFQRFEMA